MIKTCPVCRQQFESRYQRQVCCSRSCARKKEHQTRDRQERTRAPKGYVYLHVPDHPNANVRGMVMEHRIVMERVLGRLLDRRETVHHKNGKRDDNRPENLELWTLDHKDPAGVRVSDLQHCPTCTCGASAI